MNFPNDLTVLSVDNLFTVLSEQGDDSRITRRTLGLSFSYGGSITYRLGTKEFVSDHHHAILLPCASYTLQRNKTGVFPVINFTCTEDFNLSSFLLIPLKNPDVYLKDFERMKELYLTGRNPARLMSLFYGILGRLSEEGNETGTKRLLIPSMEYLSKQYQNPELTSGDLANAAGISEVYFRKLFKEAYGTTPKQYLMDLRIRQAKNMLTEQAASVTQIAEACGFSSVYHFCRTFKQITGQTPTEFRQE